MKSWTMVLNLHEKFKCIFQYHFISRCFIKTPYVIHVRKKKHEFQKQLQKPKPTKSHELLNDHIWILFSNIYICVCVCV